MTFEAFDKKQKWVILLMRNAALVKEFDFHHEKLKGNGFFLSEAKVTASNFELKATCKYFTKVGEMKIYLVIRGTERIDLARCIYKTMANDDEKFKDVFSHSILDYI